MAQFALFARQGRMHFEYFAAWAGHEYFSLSVAGHDPNYRVDPKS